MITRRLVAMLIVVQTKLEEIESEVHDLLDEKMDENDRVLLPEHLPLIQICDDLELAGNRIHKAGRLMTDWLEAQARRRESLHLILGNDVEVPLDSEGGPE